MVSQTDRAGHSRDRLLAAAAAEFAARGFAGAKVDRIAAKARLNKAMIYYHFQNKAALYREVLAEIFGTIARAVTTEVTAGQPEDQLRQFVRTIAREVGARPHFAPMWLRELADGATHVDPPILTEMRRVLQVLAGIIDRGVAAGRFQPVHPLAVHVGIVGPLLLLLASAPARDRLLRREWLGAPDAEQLLRHLERAAIGGLIPEPLPPANTNRTRRSRS